MTLENLLTQRQHLLTQIQALDTLITNHPQAPWVAIAADYIHTNQPTTALAVMEHVHHTCTQAAQPSPTYRQLIHALQARGFQRTRRSQGFIWTSPPAS